MAELDKFVDITDRYLEVSNVYSQRITQLMNDRSATTTENERIARLIAILESVNFQQSEHPVRHVTTQAAKGQSVVPTEEVLSATKKYQEIVQERFARGNTGARTPRNRTRLEKILKLPPDQFLACFNSVTYAWDILVELASISVLPDHESLAARDMIYMHCAELEVHLRKIIAQARLAQPDLQLSFKGKVSIEELFTLQGSGQLAAVLIDSTIPQSPGDLIDSIRNLLGADIDALFPNFNQDAKGVLLQLKQRERNFASLLDDGCRIEQAKEVASRLVSFGLRVGYGVWFAVTEKNVPARNSLRKNVLFCTRFLLDESRWQVGKDVSQFAIELGTLDNKREGLSDPSHGTYMLRANNLFCRRKLGEDIRAAVGAWDTTDIHPRYSFLKLILLERFSEAAELARELLQPEPETGTANMCAEEFNEWPILEDFRKTEEFAKLF